MAREASLNREDVCQKLASLTPAPLWTVDRAASPVLATAVHDGTYVRKSLVPYLSLTAAERLREEDPYTSSIISSVTNRIVVHRSRFEVDLNRSRDEAVYVRPEQAWGLQVWREAISQELITESLALHDEYYEMLASTLKSMERSCGRFVVLDVHSYNHRRSGPDRPTDPRNAPDVNIGTFSMDRKRWSYIVDPLIEHFRSFTANGKPLDVRENIAFQGKGEQTRFIHERFAQNGCAIAVEFKKIFMDEWTGQPNDAVLSDLRDAVGAAVPMLHDILERRA